MKRIKLIFGILIVLVAIFILDVLYLSRSAESPAADQAKNGIYGTITIGPQCPAPKPGEADNCKSDPYQAVVSVKTEDGSKEVEQLVSFSDGTFRLGLEPGKYLLVPSGEGSTPQPVTVEAGNFTEVKIRYNSENAPK